MLFCVAVGNRRLSQSSFLSHNSPPSGLSKQSLGILKSPAVDGLVLQCEEIGDQRQEDGDGGQQGEPQHDGEDAKLFSSP